jgi:hypothetical protein
MNREGLSGCRPDEHPAARDPLAGVSPGRTSISSRRDAVNKRTGSVPRSVGVAGWADFNCSH